MKNFFGLLEPEDAAVVGVLAVLLAIAVALLVVTA